eukprot:7826460-Pyramimonas_sp.AAC.1
MSQRYLAQTYVHHAHHARRPRGVIPFERSVLFRPRAALLSCDFLVCPCSLCQGTPILLP